VKKEKRILFLCTGNSCRSQMAEGFLEHLAGEKFEVFSAGINPTPVNPLAIKVMNEVGIDISKQKSKSVKEFLGQQFDYVVTVCDNAKQTCPIFPGKCKKMHWGIEDPKDKGIEKFREVREIICQKVKDLIQRIENEGT